MVGEISSFRSPRRFASWLGPTPRVYSSGTIRGLGSISKRGDAYLKTLLVHGGRAVLFSATRGTAADRSMRCAPRC
ncbi:transposase [Povalibacter uvarum]|uniref:transposase n=1 Tax=Povalibacter uvarum TaxID=732238 RepID=UPI0016214636